jgi:hypothetical protein
MLAWLIGISIALQLLCAGVSGFLAVKARNGSWRFWLALTVAFIGIVIRRSMWLADDVLMLDRSLLQGASIAATYLVSLAFLAAMVEAVVFHKAQRRQICSLSQELLELDRRLEERQHGRAAL